MIVAAAAIYFVATSDKKRKRSSIEDDKPTEPSAPGKPSKSKYNEKNQKYDNAMGKTWKYRTQDIESFSGKRIDWPLWKRTTHSNLAATGFKYIMMHREAADQNLIKNSQLYAILEQSVRGSALSYLIFRHETDTDGDGAFKELIKHYHIVFFARELKSLVL